MRGSFAEMATHLVLLGPPGAGKGTLGARLSTFLSVPLIITGDLMRQAGSRSDAVGVKIRSFLLSGQLVPDDLVTEVVAEALARPEVASAGFILDGFPRTLPQAHSLASILEASGRVLNAVLFLEIDEQTAVERLSLRRQCPKCGAIYHLRFSPPKAPDTCDRCGTTLVQRADDDPEVIRRRLSVYREQTAPLIEFYTERRLLIRIDAAPSPDEVLHAALSSLRELSKEPVRR